MFDEPGYRSNDAVDWNRQERAREDAPDDVRELPRLARESIAVLAWFTLRPLGARWLFRGEKPPKRRPSVPR